MDLKTNISESLWKAIETNYELNNYTGSILDAIYFLSNLIREKTGLDSDGVALIGQAFGGKTPKLRINKLQTETDFGAQKGIESLLLGLYQAIRNPRSHEKHNDKKEDADVIIIFINYLLNIIGASKGVFTKSELLARVFDRSFVRKEQYAEILVNSIPAKYRLEVMIEVFDRKEEGEIESLALFVGELLIKLNDDEITSLLEIVSKELNSTEVDNVVKMSLRIFPSTFWKRLEESARMRSEYRFINSIKKGEYDSIEGKCTSGAFGTWCSSLIPNSILKDDFISILLGKLESLNESEQDYIIKFFSWPLFKELNKQKDSDFAIRAIDIINSYLRAGDKRFYKLAKDISTYDEYWKEAFKEEFNKFQAASHIPTNDSEEPKDIPF